MNDLTKDYIYEKRLKAWKSGEYTKDNAGWVYIIGTEGHPYYKIGMAKNINKRKSALQSGSPWKLVTVVQFFSKDNELVERILHDIFESKRVLNEWFALKPGDLEIIEKLQKLLEENCKRIQ